jgi:hypothetical protein
MATATHGSAIVFPKEAFDPLATLEAVQEYKCTALYGVPTMVPTPPFLPSTPTTDTHLVHRRARPPRPERRSP